MQPQIVKDYLRYFREELEAAANLSYEGAKSHLWSAQQHAELLIPQLEILMRAKNSLLRAGAHMALQNVRDANQHTKAATESKGPTNQEHVQQAIAYAKRALKP